MYAPTLARNRTSVRSVIHDSVEEQADESAARDNEITFIIFIMLSHILSNSIILIVTQIHIYLINAYIYIHIYIYIYILNSKI